MNYKAKEFFTYHPALWAPLLRRRRGIEILYLLNIEILIYFITLLKRIQPYAHY